MTRESAQVMTTARGDCPPVRARRFSGEMSPAKAPLFTYAAFPSLSVCKTISDVCTAASLSLTTCLYTTPFYPACKGSSRYSRAKKGIKNIRKRLPTYTRCRRSSESVTVVHGHRSAGGPVLSSEPGLAEDREVGKPCFRIFIFLTCQPKMGIGSRLYASADPSDDACIWQICPFRCGPPCDLVALGEFWKSEKPSIRGTCSNMSILHDYMVLRSKEKCKWGKKCDASCSLFYGLQQYQIYHSYSKYRGLDDVYCLTVGDWRLKATRD